MSSSDDTGDGVRVLLVLTPDPEAGERLTRQLCTELADLDIESVGLAGSGTAPDSAKGTVIETVRDWLSQHSRQHRISVTIDGDTIELERTALLHRPRPQRR